MRYDKLRPKMMMTSIKKMVKMVEVDNVVCCGPPLLTSPVFSHYTTTHCITTGEGEAF